MVIVFGILHLFKRSRLEDRDWCERCLRRRRLMTYTAWEFAHVYYIPLIPLGPLHIIRKCPTCHRFGKMNAGKARQAADAAYEAAQEALTAGKLDDALTSIDLCAMYGGVDRAGEFLAKLDASDVRVLETHGTLLHMRRRFAEAESKLRQAVSVSPDNVAAHIALGKTLLESKRVDEGLNELRRAAELAPKDVDIRCVLKEELERRKRWEELRIVLEEIAAITPEMLEDKAFRKLLAKVRKKTAGTQGVNPYAQQ